MSLTDTPSLLKVAYDLYTFGDRYETYANWYIDRHLHNSYWQGYSISLLVTMKLQTSFLDLVDD